jgi:hypothetical protein
VQFSCDLIDRARVYLDDDHDDTEGWIAPATWLTFANVEYAQLYKRCRAPFWGTDMNAGAANYWQATGSADSLVVTLEPRDSAGSYLARYLPTVAYATDANSAIDLPYGSDERLVLGSRGERSSRRAPQAASSMASSSMRTPSSLFKRIRAFSPTRLE